MSFNLAVNRQKLPSTISSNDIYKHCFLRIDMDQSVFDVDNFLGFKRVKDALFGFRQRKLKCLWPLLGDKLEGR